MRHILPKLNQSLIRQALAVEIWTTRYSTDEEWLSHLFSTDEQWLSHQFSQQ